MINGGKVMKHKLKESWIWDRDINDFVKEKAEGRILNVCAGKSPVGDVKIDLDPKSKDVLEGYMQDLPFDNNEFDTVIWDPPWKIGYYKRMKPFFECLRVCKVGGKVIVNSYWIPSSKYAELKETWIRQDSKWSNVSIFAIFEKTIGNMTLDEFMEDLDEYAKNRNNQRDGDLDE